MGVGRHTAVLALALGGCDLVFSLEGPTISCPFDDEPIGYWHLDEVEDGDAKDSSTTAMDGTYAGAVTLGVAGALGTAVEFEGGRVLLGDRFGFTGREPFTVEAWILPGDGSGFRHIFTKQRRADPKQGWALLLDDTDQLYLERFIDDGNFRDSPRVEVARETWSHVAGTYDGRALRVFANGLEVGGAALDAREMPDTEVEALVGSASATLDDSSFEGAIDEVAIYDRALDSEVIRNHAEAGLAARCSEP